MNSPEYPNHNTQQMESGSPLGAKIDSAWRLLKFSARRRLKGFEIGDQPWMDDVSREIFDRMLRSSARYLEYGSGGSTVSAKKLAKAFISVDTDPFMVKAVRRKVGKLAPDQHLLYANIGWTGIHGFPVFRSENAARRKRWKAYVELPWHRTDRSHPPDLVLVDGRFRVAAALTSCARLAGALESRIVVDDYISRPWYHFIADYAKLIEIKGRMAVFQPPAECSSELLEAVQHFMTDCR